MQKQQAVLAAIVATAILGLAARLTWLESPNPSHVNGAWRRTAQGWQQATQWQAPPGYYRPSIHPLLPATFCVLTSFYAMLAWPAAAFYPPAAVTVPAAHSASWHDPARRRAPRSRQLS